jgi:hypothetical protein
MADRCDRRYTSGPDAGGGVNEANGPASPADLERLAARLAMLAAEDGEADNAGRAVGALARRLGLTGGDLKRIFLAGVPSALGGEHDRLGAELGSLRRKLAELDADAQHAAWERDVLREENGSLKAGLERMRENVRTWGLAGAGVAVVLGFIGLIAWIGHPRPESPPPLAQEAVGSHRAAVVRVGGAQLYRAPERNGVPVMALPVGQRIEVRRLLWKDLFQWAEVEAPGGAVGYVLTTEIDLS